MSHGLYWCRFAPNSVGDNTTEHLRLQTSQPRNLRKCSPLSVRGKLSASCSVAAQRAVIASRDLAPSDRFPRWPLVQNSASVKEVGFYSTFSGLAMVGMGRSNVTLQIIVRYLNSLTQPRKLRPLGRRLETHSTPSTSTFTVYYVCVKQEKSELITSFCWTSIPLFPYLWKAIARVRPTKWPTIFVREARASTCCPQSCGVYQRHLGVWAAFTGMEHGDAELQPQSSLSKFVSHQLSIPAFVRTSS